jgi:D-glycero-alpha-D-manno-heptose-7-phosphate kinase
MIISKTPLRITIAGGGTDLPSFYSEHGGFVISMAIDKYIYITFQPKSFDRKLRMRYSVIETVDDATELKNHRAKEMLLWHGVRSNCEINTCADLPSNTGLGSSGSFLVGLSHVLRRYNNACCDPAALAKDACYVEMGVLQEPVGKQDQYISAYGGVRLLSISKEGNVCVEDSGITMGIMDDFLSRVQLYYTNVTRDASDILIEQQSSNNIATLNTIKEQALASLQVIRDGNFSEYGSILDDYWKLKKTLSKKVSLSYVDDLYEVVKRHYGVLGGKIVGAGGGGFLFLFTDGEAKDLEAYMRLCGYNRLNFKPDYNGSKVCEF